LCIHYNMVFTDLEIPGIEEGKLRENSTYHLRCATFVYKEKKRQKSGNACIYHRYVNENGDGVSRGDGEPSGNFMKT